MVGNFSLLAWVLTFPNIFSDLVFYCLALCLDAWSLCICVVARLASLP